MGSVVKVPARRESAANILIVATMKCANMDTAYRASAAIQEPSIFVMMARRMATARTSVHANMGDASTFIRNALLVTAMLIVVV